MTIANTPCWLSAIKMCDPGFLAHAFEAATQVLVVSSNVHGAAAVTQHTAAIDAARAAGAERIL